MVGCRGFACSAKLPGNYFAASVSNWEWLIGVWPGLAVAEGCAERESLRSW